MLPVLIAAAGACMRSPAAVLNVGCGGMVATVAGGAVLLGFWCASPSISVPVSGGWFRVDALSAYHLMVLLLVILLSTVYARVYFGRELAEGRLTLRSAKMFSMLWALAFVSMVLVLVSDNIGIMWVSLEATTLVTAFLICIHRTRGSIEATWKYIVICSVGIAFAFLGEVLVASAGRRVGMSEEDMMLLSRLTVASPCLSPVFVKFGFLLLIVGYGTKAGLAPMHNWLPDAHSQAPAPVSALFSGFMLNAAVYCIVRHLPIVNGAVGSGWANGFMVGFGLLSIVVAAGFILFQRDLKRLLAYSSVEHVGIMVLGVGLGGLGTFAALFHMLNHSLGKTLAFFAAGRAGQIYGTHEMSKMHGMPGVTRVWGTGIAVSVLALLGVAPFSVFMSELQVVVAAVSNGAVFALIVFLIGTATVFIGALGHIIPVVWGDSGSGQPQQQRSSPVEWGLLGLVTGALLLLGVWMPGPLQSAIDNAVAVIEHVPGKAVEALKLP